MPQVQLYYDDKEKVLLSVMIFLWVSERTIPGFFGLPVV